MKWKTFLFLSQLLIYFVTEVLTCDLYILRTDCTGGGCRELKQKSEMDNEWMCPDGSHLEYSIQPENSMKITTSGIICIGDQFALADDTSVILPIHTVVVCRVKGLSGIIIVVIIICALTGIGSAIGGICFYMKCIKQKGGEENEEEGKKKEVNTASAEPTSGMNKPKSSMESTNKRSSDNDDSSERKKSEKENKEKGGSIEQPSRNKGEIVENKEREDKEGSREKRKCKEKGKSKESGENRGKKERKGGSKEKKEKKEEGGSMEKGRKGIGGGGSKEAKSNGKRPRIQHPKIDRGNTHKESEQAKLNQRKGKLPVPNLAKCETWDDALFEEILKVWMNFSINERIGFCEQMLRKMNGTIAVQFMRLFQSALFIEADRRVWTKLHECFRLLYAQCEAEYYMNICERMYQSVAAAAADKMEKLGWQEKATDNVDDAYIRYICADLVLFDCQTDNIAKLYNMYEEKKFSFVSPLRIAVWTRVVREDDLSNEKKILQNHLFEESKLPRVKFPTEEYGTKLQHLIYAASTSKDPSFTKELWMRLVIEKEITPADLVFVFKGTMIYPSARKRCLDLFMEEAFFREKIPSDCPEYKEILRLFANSCVREVELQKIKDHVMADFAFTEVDKKSFEFEMLERRMGLFLTGVPTLHATMNKYLIEDRDFLVHKK